MFVDYWHNDFLVTRAKDLEEFAVWDGTTGRYGFRAKVEVSKYLWAATSDRMEHVSELLAQEIAGLQERADKGQLKPDEPDIEDLEMERKKLYGYIQSLGEVPTTRRILERLHDHDEIIVPITSFDPVAGYIGVKGGETLITDGPEAAVRVSKRSDYLTMSTGVPYEAGYTHPEWERFLDTFLPDADLRRFTQKALGYTLIDGNPDKLMFFLWGGSNTGKTTILEAISAALGDYGASVDAGKILSDKASAGQPELINAAKNLFIVFSEAGAGKVFSANTIKDVTGNSTQQARFNHGNQLFDLTLRFAPYLTTNTVPDIKGMDDATKRRILVLPFQSKVKPEPVPYEQDVVRNPEIHKAILVWLVEGLNMYHKEGLKNSRWPMAVRTATDDFASGVSVFADFKRECIQPTRDPDRFIAWSKVWEKWSMYAKDNQISERETGVDSPRELYRNMQGFFSQEDLVRRDGKTLLFGYSFK